MINNILEFVLVFMFFSLARSLALIVRAKAITLGEYLADFIIDSGARTHAHTILLWLLSFKITNNEGVYKPSRRFQWYFIT